MQSERVAGTKRPLEENKEDDDTVLLASNELDGPEIVVPRLHLIGSVLEKRVEKDPPDYNAHRDGRGVWRTNMSPAVLRSVAQSLSVGYVVVGHGASLESLLAAFDYLCLSFKGNVSTPFELAYRTRSYWKTSEARHDTQDVLVRRLALRISTSQNLSLRLKRVDERCLDIPCVFHGLGFGVQNQEWLHDLQTGSINGLSEIAKDSKLFIQACQVFNVGNARGLYDCSRMLVEFLPNTMTMHSHLPRFDLEKLTRASAHSLDDYLNLPTYITVACFLSAACKLTHHKRGTPLDQSGDLKITWSAVFRGDHSQDGVTRLIKAGDFQRVKDVVLLKSCMEAGDEIGWLFKYGFAITCVEDLTNFQGAMNWFATRICRPSVNVSTSDEMQDALQMHHQTALVEHAFCVDMLQFCSSVIRKEPDWNALLSNQFADEEGGQSTPAREKLASELVKYGIRVVRWKTVFTAKGTSACHDPSPVTHFPKFLDHPEQARFAGYRTQALLEWIPSAVRER
ncbi:MAG: hypothetical protein CMI16_12875 [Opitutaceae bacterium]|nr:hypothetical protein [Opitutaceae bacterium]